MDFCFNKSLLSREESNSIKGILIILITLGHNIPFVNLTDSWMFMVWLYLFHLQAFFILPYLYSVKPISWSRLRSLLVRYYVPFTFFFFLLFAIRYYNGTRNMSFSKFPLVFLGGGGLYLKQFTGVQFLWFLPAMCICSIIKETFARCGTFFRAMMIVLGFAVTVCSIISFPQAISSDKITYLVLGLRILCVSCLVRMLILKQMTFVIPAVLAFVLGSFAFFVHYRLCIRPFYIGYFLTSFYGLLRIIMSLAFVLLLYASRIYLSKSTLLRYLGEKSLYVYVFHGYCGYLGNWLFSKLGIPLPLSSIFCLTLMLGGALVLTKILSLFPRVQRFVFPRELADLCFWNDTKPNRA